MIIIGLTGSIGMGKTTTANMFAALGVAVLDSDSIVHELLHCDESIIKRVGAIFPDALIRGSLDRSVIGKAVFADPKRLSALEAILHPAVKKMQAHFIKTHKQNGAKAVLLDIPLLFETGAEKRVDVVVVVTAPASIQKERVMKRKGMSEEKFKRILKRQMPDAQKRKRADFIVHTSEGKRKASAQVKTILKTLLNN